MNQHANILSVLLIGFAMAGSLKKSKDVHKIWTKTEVRDLIDGSENFGKPPNVGHSKANHFHSDARSRDGSGAGATYPTST